MEFSAEQIEYIMRKQYEEGFHKGQVHAEQEYQRGLHEGYLRAQKDIMPLLIENKLFSVPQPVIITAKPEAINKIVEENTITVEDVARKFCEGRK